MLVEFSQNKSSGLSVILDYASQAILNSAIRQNLLKPKQVVENSTGVNAASYVLVGPSLLEMNDEAVEASLAGRNYVYCQSLDSLNIYLATAGSRHVHVIFDLDSFGGITEVYDGLRNVRDTYPKVRVIVVSGSFLVNDFDLERLPLCDASLRWPVRSKTLEEAFHHADTNNKVWNKRLMEQANA